MLPRSCAIVFSGNSKLILLAVAILVCASPSLAEPLQSRLVVRDNVTRKQKEELVTKLKEITGWKDLSIDKNGTLRIGPHEPTSGSSSARLLLEQSTAGPHFIVIESVSRRADVAFARVIPGKWKRDSPNNIPPFVIQVDFTDFSHVIGDRRALKAFDVAWALLHELDHVVNDSVDASGPSDQGVCEAHINQMRREIGLPERTDYFFTYLPQTDATFATRLVRLGFETNGPAGDKKNRYWLVWDASLVGGLPENRQIASLR